MSSNASTPPRGSMIEKAPQASRKPCQALLFSALQETTHRPTSMAGIDASEAMANAQALADSFAQQDPGDELPSAQEQVPGEPDGGANPAKRKLEDVEEQDEAMRKRSSFTAPDTNGVR